MKLYHFASVSWVGLVSAFTPSVITNKSSSSLRESPKKTTALYERKPFISGNWKLNPGTRDEALEIAGEIASAVTPESPCDVALFVPYPFIESVKRVVDGKLTVGAEMVDFHLNGAFTGAISPPMLDSMGVEWALAGHSERRIINKEDDETINKQCLRLIDQNMSVMLCIGETEEEYEKNLVGSICEIQLKKGLAGISANDMSRVAIAYEPVWAIGTGKVATPETAQKVHKICRGIIADMYGESVAEKIRILYGGSVSDESVDGLMEQPDIDGCLVGGASLSAEKFGRIINFQSVGSTKRIGKRQKLKNFIKSILRM